MKLRGGGRPRSVPDCSRVCRSRTQTESRFFCYLLLWTQVEKCIVVYSRQELQWRTNQQIFFRKSF